MKESFSGQTCGNSTEDLCESEPRGCKVAWMFAIISFCYCCQGSFAQVIDGCTNDGALLLCWEYDLEHATGQINITNLAAFGFGLGVRLEGVVPAGVSVLDHSPQLTRFNCSAIGAIIPGWPIEARLGVGEVGMINFAYPVDYFLVDRSVDHFQAASAANCVAGIGFFPGTLTNFVSVAPIACLNHDVEPDGDVDLVDFAAFQNGYGSAPEDFRVPCFSQFVQDYSGPLLSA